MPAAIPVVTQAAAAAIVSATGVGVAGSALIYGASAIVGGLLARELIGRGEEAGLDDVSIRENHIATNRTLPIIYGKRLIGSNDVFIEMGTRGEVTNEGGYLWIVSVLGEGLTDSIDSDETGELIYIDDKRIQEYPDGVVERWFYRGTNTQLANPALTTGTRIGAQEKYTDPLRNTSYIIFRLKYSREYFIGIPRREFVIKGQRLKDIRTGSSVWSQNPALVLYDFVTNTRYGLGWSKSSIDQDSWKETANYCDTAGWVINYVVSSQMKSQSIIETLLGHFRGYLLWYNGSLYLKFMDLLRGEPIVFNIEDSQIARDQSGKALVRVTHPSKFSLPDGLSVGYINDRDNWTTDNVIVGESEGQIRQINFAGFTNRTLALDMGTYTLERQRLSRVLSFVLRPNTVVLDPNDVVHITCKELGLVQTIARIKSTSVGEDGLISISAVYDADTLYNQAFDPDTSETYETNFPSIIDEPTSVTQGDPPVEITYNYRERSYVRLNVFFNRPDSYPWYSHVDVYIAEAEDKEQPSPPPLENFIFKFTAANNFQLDPVEEGQTYYFKLVTVSVYLIKQKIEDALFFSHKVKGVEGILPKCPQYLEVTTNMSSVELYSSKIDDPDISGYEFRVGPVGTSWKDSIFLTKQSNPSVSFSGVVPGEYTFWINTQHTNRYYCPEPKSVDVLVPDPPPNSFVFFETDIDFSSGSYDNTEFVSPNKLKRISGSDKIGSFITETGFVPNENPEKKALVYLKGTYVVEGGGETWNDLITPTTDWYEFAYNSDEDRWLTWSELVPTAVLNDPEKLKITVLYSRTSGGPFKEAHNLELLTGIIYGEYIKVRFDIEDATSSSFIVLEGYSFHAAYLIESLLISA